MTKTTTQKPQVVFAIPARYASTRLPAKPLARLGDSTLVECVLDRVAELAQRTQRELKDTIAAVHIVLATDNADIGTLAQKKNVFAAMTSPDLPSGTDRIFAALQNKALPFSLFENDVVLNIQGDEPFFPIDACLSLVKSMLALPDNEMGTLAFRRHTLADFVKPSMVKVVVDASGNALYFSRAPIPWPREIFGASNTPDYSRLSTTHVEFLQHVGVYAFRLASLRAFTTLLKKSLLEEREGLEQLRAVEAGWKIGVVESLEEPFGIDTPDDLAQAQLRVRSAKMARQGLSR